VQDAELSAKDAQIAALIARFAQFDEAAAARVDSQTVKQEPRETERPRKKRSRQGTSLQRHCIITVALCYYSRCEHRAIIQFTSHYNDAVSTCAVAEVALEQSGINTEALKVRVKAEPTAAAEEEEEVAPAAAVQHLLLANSIEQDESHDEHLGTNTLALKVASLHFAEIACSMLTTIAIIACASAMQYSNDPFCRVACSCICYIQLYFYEVYCSTSADMMLCCCYKGVKSTELSINAAYADKYSDCLCDTQMTLMLKLQ
jgi:hypothetical protein